MPIRVTQDVQRELSIAGRFHAINGVLIPGGGARLIPTHRFYDVSAQLVRLAQAANDKGIHFPVRQLGAVF